MPDYKEYHCPVCNRQFEDGDDIVTCPECGTPHHRECYNLTGHCVNQGLHSANYSFLDDQKRAKYDHENIVEQAKTERAQNIGSMPIGDNEDEAETKSFSDIAGMIMPDPVKTKYDSDSSKIDGYEIGDIAATIRTNIDTYLKKFKKQSDKRSKIGWNWGAFLFGSLYMFFRKMYKQGFAFLTLIVSTILISDTIMIKMAPNYIHAMQEFMNSYIQGEFKTTQAVMDAMKVVTGSSDAQTAVTIAYITYGVIFLIRIIAALFSDYFYKQTVYNIIKRVSDLLDNGASFTQTPLFAPQQAELSQAQMKRMYLANKGGISVFAPMLVISFIYLILSIIS